MEMGKLFNSQSLGKNFWNFKYNVLEKPLTELFAICIFLSCRRFYYPFGGLVLIGKAAVLKTAGFTPLGVRVPRPPL